MVKNTQSYFKNSIKEIHGTRYMLRDFISRLGSHG